MILRQTRSGLVPEQQTAELPTALTIGLGCVCHDPAEKSMTATTAQDSPWFSGGKDVSEAGQPMITQELR